MFKALAAAALATAFTAAPALAETPHNTLARMIETAGVDLQVNPSDCFTREGVMGWYNGRQRRMVVCLENGANARWTQEDLDTLRHEAQHMIQDCMVGAVNDSVLGPVYQQPISLAKSVLSQQKIEWIIEAYRGQGASDHVVILELEAFAVAAINDPIDQARDIQKFCMA